MAPSGLYARLCHAFLVQMSLCDDGDIDIVAPQISR